MKIDFANPPYKHSLNICDVGKIVAIRYVDPGIYRDAAILRIETEDGIVESYGKPSFTRCCCGCCVGVDSIFEERMKQELEKLLDKQNGENNELREKITNIKHLSLNTTDFRVVRAQDVMWYYVAQEKDESYINEKLADAHKWTLDEAEQWLRKNELPVSREFMGGSLISKNSHYKLPNYKDYDVDYVYDCSQLKYPDFKPTK